MSNHDLLVRHQQEKLALNLVHTVGDLRFDKGIELIMFRKAIYDAKPSEIIRNHILSQAFIDQSIPLELTVTITNIIAQMDSIVPARIDVGTIAVEWLSADKSQGQLEEFIEYKLGAFTSDDFQSSPRHVVLYGFGRIGRLLARIIIDTTGRGDQLRLKAIVLRSKLKDRKAEIEKRLALLEDDSVHGTFLGRYEIAEDLSSVVINGSRIAMIFASSPADIDYTEYGIHNALLIDNTGIFRDKEGLSNHLRPGIEKVLLTAPGDDIPNIVYGVNHEGIEDEQIVSAASCTTNAIVPPIKIIDDNFGIEKGHLETIHSYTSDQNLLDNFHKKPRRGRSAAINMVLTNTGAAKAVSKVFPHLKGILTGNAVRVPTPNVSIAILVLHLKRKASVDEINTLIREASLSGDLAEQLHYSISEEFVSSHVVGYNATSIVDAPSTIVSEDGKLATIYAWYDNEYGYSHQVVRLAKHMGKVRRKVLY